jgi:hypothetical protein
MESQTPIQRQIENQVTSGRGYDRGNTSRTPYKLLNTEVGVQIALCNMDTSDGKLDMYTVIGFSSQLEAMLKKFDDALIPIDVITDANGFKKAFDSSATFGRSPKPAELFFGRYVINFFKKIVKSVN